MKNSESDRNENLVLDPGDLRLRIDSKNEKADVQACIGSEMAEEKTIEGICAILERIVFQIGKIIMEFNKPGY